MCLKTKITFINNLPVNYFTLKISSDDLGVWRKGWDDMNFAGIPEGKVGSFTGMHKTVVSEVDASLRCSRSRALMR